jgi:predicted nucleotidyltransferase
MGLDSVLLETPNNILAVEYCKAILSQKSTMQPLPIYREGSYHSLTPDRENPSATFLRQALLSGKDWQRFVPKECVDLFLSVPLHSLEAGERAILGKLRTMSDAEFEALPGGSEGLWRKLMRAARECTTLEEIATYVKSKRYTRTRIDRMILCAFLGISEEMLHTPAPYVRVLALNDRGREILKLARQHGDFVNAGEAKEGAYADLESRCGSLYGLFAEDTIEPPNAEDTRRVRYTN